MSLFQKSVLNKYLKSLNTSEVDIAWEKFRNHFQNAIIRQNITLAKEEEYQEGFVRDLFVNILGYTLKPQPDFNFVLEQKSSSDATKSDGAILSSAGDVIAIIELKDTTTSDLGKVEKQAFGYKHQHKDCRYIITSNFKQLRFYINDAVHFEVFDLFKLTRESFAVLYCCLHKTAIHNDIPLKIKEQSLEAEENITKKLYADYSGFKRLLFEDIVLKNPQFDQLVLFKKTQKLLDRFLFILFAEDRLLLPPNSVRVILQEWEKLKELDNYVPLYERFKKYFGYLNTGYKGNQYEIFPYNGGLFLPDEILDNILVNDQLLYDSCRQLSNYDFESEVDVNILGHIFEHSLNEIEEIENQLNAGEAISSEKKISKRKKDGVFYTPRYITKYIVDNTLGILCTKKKAELNIIDEDFAPQKRKATTQQLLQKLETYRAWLLQLTICDPGCGSGAFLNQALEFLIEEHRYIDELKSKLFGDLMLLSDVENSILENNLFGVDINEEATEIAKLSLWLRTAKKGRKLNSLNHNIKCGNSLIDDTKVAGEKAFKWEDEFPEVFAKGGFDVVIGNPPYVTGNSLDGSRQFISTNYKTAQYQLDLYILFIERSVGLILPHGIIGFITPNSWLKNMMMSECRKFLLDNTYLLKISPNLPKVFDDAAVDSSIFFLIKNKDIYTNTEVTDYINNDFIFKHFIHQDNFRKNDRMIFSVEMNTEKQSIIDLIRVNTVELGDIFDVTRGINPYDKYTGQSREVIESKAYHADFQKDETFVPQIRGKDVMRYNYEWDKKSFISYGNWLAAPRNPKYFTGKRIIFREILGKNFVCTFIEKEIKIDRSLYIALHQNECYDCKFVLSILASTLLAFYFRNVNNEFDILFPKIRLTEFKKLPIKIIPNIDQLPLIAKADTMLSKNKELHQLKQQFLHLLQSKYEHITFSKKLQNWPELSFNEFLKEITKQKIHLTLPEQVEWMYYFEEEKTKAKNLMDILIKTDKEIDLMVYNLYSLTGEEIAMVENS